MQVDAVFSGGGVKAIAMIGAIEALEIAGIKFKRLAGTSAGAIIAAYLAAGYTSKELKELVMSINFRHFLDERASLFPFHKWLRLYWKLGLYKGDQLEDWMKKTLAQKKIVLFKDLEPERLKVVVSDLSLGRLVVIPDELHEYGINGDCFSVAKALRMSSSLPYFFEPIVINHTKGQKSIIVDGGVLSNFPLWLFGDFGRTRPVIGFQLTKSFDIQQKRKIEDGIDLFQALFETMRDAHDARYISKYALKNVVFLPVESVQTTAFQITNKQKEALIQLGKERTIQFLKHWP